LSLVNEVIYAKAGLFQLGILAVVALISFGLRSRLTLLLGGLGTQLGLLIPKPLVYADYSSVEGAVMGVINDSVKHLTFWAPIGATLGVLLALGLRSWRASDEQADRVCE
jgi:hypothetical protein